MANLSLYFIRHGIAAERGTYANDDDRPLTDEGRKKTRQVAKKLYSLGLKFDLIQSSPLVRAMQTADIFKDAAENKCPIEVSDFLAPDGDFEAWLDWLSDWRKAGGDSLGIIGHEPDLSTWAELMVWGEARGALVLKKAGIIGVALPESSVPPAGNSLLFLLVPPKLLVSVDHKLTLEQANRQR